VKISLSTRGSVVPLSRNRDFVLLWTGQALSSLGSQTGGIAYPLLTLALTHSPAKAGVVAFALSLPYTLFVLLAQSARSGRSCRRRRFRRRSSRASRAASTAPRGSWPCSSRRSARSRAGTLLEATSARATVAVVTVWLLTVAVATSLSGSIRAAPSLAALQTD
jgi:hypothetical protein